MDDFAVIAVGGLLELVISPIMTGSLMERYGRARSHFATFWGGALFALSIASVRFHFVACKVSNRSWLSG